MLLKTQRPTRVVLMARPKYVRPRSSRTAASQGCPTRALPNTPVEAEGLASPAFDDGTPLWYYVLAESERVGGKKLGPVGARIVADIFTRLLMDGGGGILRSHFSPKAPVADVPGQFGLADFLVYAGVATRPRLRPTGHGQEIEGASAPHGSERLIALIARSGSR
jgi:hypothetical protein